MNLSYTELNNVRPIGLFTQHSAKKASMGLACNSHFRVASTTGVFRSEADALSFIRRSVPASTELYADEAGSWNELHARYTLHRINHQEAYSLPGEVYTNQAESFFSRMRRAEIGHHHHVAGPYLLRFAQEAAWREDHRREPNGSHVDRIVALAMRNKPSIDFCGYWQRGRAA